jgi:hypothetical protein
VQKDWQGYTCTRRRCWQTRHIRSAVRLFPYMHRRVHYLTAWLLRLVGRLCHPFLLAHFPRPGYQEIPLWICKVRNSRNDGSVAAPHQRRHRHRCPLLPFANGGSPGNCVEFTAWHNSTSSPGNHLHGSSCPCARPFPYTYACSCFRSQCRLVCWSKHHCEGMALPNNEESRRRREKSSSARERSTSSK